MKITIDTAKDSNEDIMKAIGLLKRLIKDDRSDTSDDIGKKDNPDSFDDGIFNIFEDDDKKIDTTIKIEQY